jgi:RNA polymerase sporulation-specific sigma factor
MVDETEERDFLAGCFGSSGYQVHQIIPDDLDALTTESAEATAERDQDAEFLRHAMSALTARQRDVLELRYGINSGRGHTQVEVATMLGISQQTVAQHEQSAMCKVRVLLAEVF